MKKIQDLLPKPAHDFQWAQQAGGLQVLVDVKASRVIGSVYCNPRSQALQFFPVSGQQSPIFQLNATLEESDQVKDQHLYFPEDPRAYARERVENLLATFYRASGITTDAAPQPNPKGTP